MVYRREIDEKRFTEASDFGGIALAFFIPVVLMGGLVFQIVVGLIAMLGVHELLKMKGLQTETIEGALAMLAALVLRCP